MKTINEQILRMLDAGLPVVGLIGVNGKKNFRLQIMRHPDHPERIYYSEVTAIGRIFSGLVDDVLTADFSDYELCLNTGPVMEKE